MSDLSTQYLGLELTSPLVASSSPLTRNLSGLKQLEDVGASAVTPRSTRPAPGVHCPTARSRSTPKNSTRGLPNTWTLFDAPKRPSTSR
jgi:dihydroorotate dehydrogenase